MWSAVSAPSRERRWATLSRAAATPSTSVTRASSTQVMPHAFITTLLLSPDLIKLMRRSESPLNVGHVAFVRSSVFMSCTAVRLALSQTVWRLKWKQLAVFDQSVFRPASHQLPLFSFWQKPLGFTQWEAKLWFGNDLWRKLHIFVPNMKILCATRVFLLSSQHKNVLVLSFMGKSSCSKLNGCLYITFLLLKTRRKGLQWLRTVVKLNLCWLFCW